VKLIPNPVTIPTMVTGFSQQSMEWIAEHGDGWIQYPRSIEEQASLIRNYRTLTDIKSPGALNCLLKLYISTYRKMSMKGKRKFPSVIV
jgi:hypothetical protein